MSCICEIEMLICMWWMCVKCYWHLKKAPDFRRLPTNRWPKLSDGFFFTYFNGLWRLPITLWATQTYYVYTRINRRKCRNQPSKISQRDGAFRSTILQRLCCWWLFLTVVDGFRRPPTVLNRRKWCSFFQWILWMNVRM